jgi:hypothetical protein
MTVIFYKYNDIKNKINKTLSGGLTVNDVIMHNDFDITAFELLIKNSNFNSEYNYCYIQDLGRYYFIESVEKMNGTIYKIRLTVDVLKSFSTQIENINAIITKSENPDDNFVDCEKSENYTSEVINLTDNFNHSGNLILVTSLGGE